MGHRRLQCIAYAGVICLLLFPSVISNSFGGVPPPPDLTISKVGPPGKVEMSDQNGPVKKKTLNDMDTVRICNNLQNGNNVVLTVRDKNGQIVHQQIIGPHQCVDLVVGSGQLPSGANYKVSGGSFIDLDETIDENQGVAVFELESLVGGTLLPIDTTALLLAGAQSTSWMIPVVLSIVGFGLFLSSRKSQNS